MENFKGIPPLPKQHKIQRNHMELIKQPQVMEMDSILQRVRPIKGVFNSDEEIQKLLSVPKKRRREAISIFKDKLMRQREAWALCRTTIEERIEANPDIQREEMIGIISQFSSSYGFAESHTKIAEQLIDDYISQHKRVAEIRKKYPDDIALINQLTKMKFTRADAEDFSIAIGPMSIDLSCSEFNAQRIYYGPIPTGFNMPVVNFNCVGFASQSRDKQPIYYTVVNTTTSLGPEYDDYRKEILPHEHEHEKNNLLKPRLDPSKKIRDNVQQSLNQGVVGFLRHQIYEKVLGFERNFETELLKRYESSRDHQQKSFFLEEYMRLKRESAFNCAKNEIVALYKGGRLLIPDKNIFDIFLSKDGSPYDYLGPLRDWGKFRTDSLWQEISKRVWVDEYRSIIQNAINQFNMLLNSGYSREDAIALLSDKTLPDWPKTVKRLLEAKISQN